MIASTGSKIVSISRIPVSLIVSSIEALIASTASDDCKRLQIAKNTGARAARGSVADLLRKAVAVAGGQKTMEAARTPAAGRRRRQ